MAEATVHRGDIASMLGDMKTQQKSVLQSISNGASNYMDNLRSGDVKTIAGTIVSVGLVVGVAYAVVNDLVQAPDIEDIKQKSKQKFGEAKDWAKETHEGVTNWAQQKQKQWTRDPSESPDTKEWTVLGGTPGKK